MVESTDSGSPQLNIYQKILAVASELKPLERDGQVEIKGREAYKYISHDAVTLAVRAPMLSHGLIVVPTVTECKNDGNRTEMRVRLEVINADAPSERISTEAVGYGVDPSDKGPGKAYSYALKYAYLKLFMLNTGEDIELYDDEHDPATPRGSQIEKAKEQTRQAIETAAKNLKAAIDGAASNKELLAIQRENKEWLMEIPEVTREYFIDLIEARKKQIEGNTGK